MGFLVIWLVGLRVRGKALGRGSGELIIRVFHGAVGFAAFVCLFVCVFF